MASKKRYVGHIIWKEGEVKNELNYMGLELVRSDSSRYTKRILTDFFQILLIEGNTSKASKYIRESYMSVKNGKIPVQELAIPKGVRAASRNDSPHKRGIENTQRIFNYYIPDGIKPRLIYLKSYPYELCIDDELDISAWTDKVDWELTLDKNVTKKVKLYAESAGINWEKLIRGQQGIHDWL